MRLKERPNDFQVTELLNEGLLQERGAHRVYRVTKRKLTSLEAASELARLAGVSPGEVAMAGLKDRQGVTHQYMSVPGGDPVRLSGNELSIQQVGALPRPIGSEDSEGNAFKIFVRDLGEAELARMRAAIAPVREFGVPNYFDEQRFGNLRHGQGWIYVDLARGDVSGALKRLVASASPHDTAEVRRFKAALWRKWGDWRSCRELAGKLGRHHSVFEHLKREPDDLIGGLHRVASRERLIHLFAFQSHLWNRVLSDWLARYARDSFTLRNVEGKLTIPRGLVPLPEAWGGVLPLPGPRLAGVTDPEQRALFEAVLARHGLTTEQLDVQGVPGFQLAAEPRAAVVVPRELRVRPAKQDPLHPGRHMVELSFALPRGAYATLVVQRLVGPRPAYGSSDAPWAIARDSAGQHDGEGRRGQDARGSRAGDHRDGRDRADTGPAGRGEAEFRHRRSGADSGGEGPRRHGQRRGVGGGPGGPRGTRGRGPRGSRGGGHGR